jgi:hypothetical protein
VVIPRHADRPIVDTTPGSGTTNKPAGSAGRALSLTNNNGLMWATVN